MLVSTKNYQLIEKGIKVIVEPSTIVLNPRTEMDGWLSKLVFEISGFGVINEMDIPLDELNDWYEVKDYIELNEDVKMVIPVSEENSMPHETILRISKDINDRDCIGFIVIRDIEYEQDYPNTKPTEDEIKDILKKELQMFQDYLNGNMFDLIIREDGQVVESCGMFYGDTHETNGIKDVLIDIFGKKDGEEFFDNLKEEEKDDKIS